MSTPKTPLLAQLRRLMQLAMHASEQQIPANEAKAHFDQKRRDFLTRTGKAALALGALPVLEACQKNLGDVERAMNDVAGRNKKTNPRIAIIGAGMAGLHAAWLLKQNGYAATVFEASNRTGGRMWSAQNIMAPGLVTEVGGEFIDSIHKDMITLAKTFNLELIDTRDKALQGLAKDAYEVNGILYTEEQVIEAFLPYAQLIKKDQLSMSPVITADSFSPSDQMLDNMSIAQYFDRIGLNGWLREILDAAYVIEFGRSIEEQTALNFLWMISPKVKDGSFEVFGVSDERYKIKGGNQQLCDKLAEAISGQVELGNVLTSIRQLNSGAYELTFNAGGNTRTEVSDIVLITIPFTLLRDVAIEPAWPEWKRRAIFDIGYGNNSKLMLGFTHRYWYDLGYTGGFYSNSFLQSGWENSLLQPGMAGGLTVYSGGDQAIAVGSGTPDFQASLHLPALEQVFAGAGSHYNGNASRFVWPTFPWTKSSYTCFLPGQYTSIAGNEIKPVGNIFFAGEHCSYDYQGYMNGAAETGRLAAERILKMVM